METKFVGVVDLRNLSQDELLANTKKLVESERRISVEVLHHLAEIDRRRTYAKLGFSSLWDYVTKELKYSENAAYRRITAMRALRLNPGLEEKIESGALSVTTVSQVQSFLKAEQYQANRIYSQTEKAALFEKCENKTSREVTRELLSISPLAIRVQKERVIAENRTVVSFIADTDLLGKMNRVRDLSVTRLRDPGSYPELMNLMSEVTLDEIDPLRKKPRAQEKAPSHPEENPDKNVALIAPKETPHNTSITTSTRRTISPSLRAQIWREFEGRCAFVDPKSGRRCNSTFGLEIEHCKPFSLGGSSKDPGNLRLLCRHHNQWQAIQTYGLKKMEPYLKREKPN